MTSTPKKFNVLRMFSMPQDSLDKLDLTQLWAFVIVLWSGGIGGCAAAFMGKRNPINSFMTLAGYIVTGSFGAVVMFGFLSVVIKQPLITMDQIVLWSCLTGFSTSLSMAGTNFTLKFILKKLGLELDIQLKKIVIDDEAKEG